MRNYIKNEDGFSLLEVILSIGIVAILSIFILEMFLASSKANLKAKNMDFTSNYSISTIELFKSCKTPSEFFLKRDFSGAQIRIGQSEYIVVDNIESTIDDSIVDKGIDIYQFFDKDWGLIEQIVAEKDPLFPQNKNIRYALSCTITSMKNSSEINAGTIYKVEARAYDLSYKEDINKKELVGYEALSYIPNR